MPWPGAQAAGEDGGVNAIPSGADDRRGVGEVQATRRGSMGAVEDQGDP